MVEAAESEYPCCIKLRSVRRNTTMKKIVVLLVILTSSYAFGQAQSLLTLKKKILAADSVIVISYDHKAGTGDRQTLMNGKLNSSMLK
jgi:hypothetical protein